MTIARGFHIGVDPVSVGDYRAFVEATGHLGRAGPMLVREAGGMVPRPDRDWRSPGHAQRDHHPVVGVDWHDANAYAAWLNDALGAALYRLPGEAEWEYACRVGTTTARPWGNAWNPARADAGSRRLAPARPDRFAPNTWGLRAMIGGVWEWCADVWTDGLEMLPPDGAPRLDGEPGMRAVRGGSWDGPPAFARSGLRSWNAEGARNPSLGFRLARTAVAGVPV